MEQQIRYLISDAAKQVEVESHVLRYWEEELEIPIKRNELGHRYYTKEDVERFKEIKNLKEQGLQLKAIRMILKDGKLERLKSNDSKVSKEINNSPQKKEFENQMIEIVSTKEMNMVSTESKEEKSMRLQMLLQHMIAEAVKDNNKELCNDIKECVLKEMDYQFRLQEEREEVRAAEHDKKEDEHYKRIDELLRSYSRRGRKEKKESEKKSRFSARKKPSIV